MDTLARVTGLWIYPVKSCRGIELTEMPIGSTGPENDRRWMIVDQDNHFITRRTEPRLAEIKTSIQGPYLHLYMGSNKVLIDQTVSCAHVEPVTVWNDTFLAGIETKDINEAISDFLSKTVKLVRYQAQSFRDLKTAATNAVKETMFADSRPVLLTNENSLRHLNTLLTEPSAMDRFRPNIVIDGPAAFQEDLFQNIQIGAVKFQNPKLCARCPVITQDMDLAGELYFQDETSNDNMLLVLDPRQFHTVKAIFNLNNQINTIYF